MTLEAFRLLRGLEDHRVQMTFSDGQVLVATLISVTVDLAGAVISSMTMWSRRLSLTPKPRKAAMFGTQQARICSLALSAP